MSLSVPVAIYTGFVTPLVEGEVFFLKPRKCFKTNSKKKGETPNLSKLCSTQRLRDWEALTGNRRSPLGMSRGSWWVYQ